VVEAVKLAENLSIHLESSREWQFKKYQVQLAYSAHYSGSLPNPHGIKFRLLSLWTTTFYRTYFCTIRAVHNSETYKPEEGQKRS
jgi:hypothetical protein